MPHFLGRVRRAASVVIEHLAACSIPVQIKDRVGVGRIPDKAIGRTAGNLNALPVVVRRIGAYGDSTRTIYSDARIPGASLAVKTCLVVLHGRPIGKVDEDAEIGVVMGLVQCDAAVVRIQETDAFGAFGAVAIDIIAYDRGPADVGMYTAGLADLHDERYRRAQARPVQQCGCSTRGGTAKRGFRAGTGEDAEALVIMHLVLRDEIILARATCGIGRRYLGFAQAGELQDAYALLAIPVEAVVDLVVQNDIAIALPQVNAVAIIVKMVMKDKGGIGSIRRVTREQPAYKDGGGIVLTAEPINLKTLNADIVGDDVQAELGPGGAGSCNFDAVQRTLGDETELRFVDDHSAGISSRIDLDGTTRTGRVHCILNCCKAASGSPRLDTQARCLRNIRIQWNECREHNEQRDYCE